MNKIFYTDSDAKILLNYFYVMLFSYYLCIILLNIGILQRKQTLIFFLFHPVNGVCLVFSYFCSKFKTISRRKMSSEEILHSNEGLEEITKIVAR